MQQQEPEVLLNEEVLTIGMKEDVTKTDVELIVMSSPQVAQTSKHLISDRLTADSITERICLCPVFIRM